MGHRGQYPQSKADAQGQIARSIGPRTRSLSPAPVPRNRIAAPASQPAIPLAPVQRAA
jgi:hypothetical protein